MHLFTQANQQRMKNEPSLAAREDFGKTELRVVSTPCWSGAGCTRRKRSFV